MRADNAGSIAVSLEVARTLGNGALATSALYCVFPDEKRRLVAFKDLSKSDGLLADTGVFLQPES